MNQMAIFEKKKKLQKQQERIKKMKRPRRNLLNHSNSNKTI